LERRLTELVEARSRRSASLRWRSNGNIVRPPRSKERLEWLFQKSPPAA
jgi:hypothetical protein